MIRNYNKELEECLENETITPTLYNIVSGVVYNYSIYLSTFFTHYKEDIINMTLPYSMLYLSNFRPDKGCDIYDYYRTCVKNRVLKCYQDQDLKEEIKRKKIIRIRKDKIKKVYETGLYN